MLKKFYDQEEMSLDTRSDTIKKLEIRSDAIRRQTIDSEETPSETYHSGLNMVFSGRNTSNHK